MRGMRARAPEPSACHASRAVPVAGGLALVNLSGWGAPPAFAQVGRPESLPLLLRLNEQGFVSGRSPRG
eukprot:11164371-Lingulodinium_polyedra.AAC.1